jgi:hypothetical protein
MLRAKLTAAHFGRCPFSTAAESIGGAAGGWHVFCCRGALGQQIAHKADYLAGRFRPAAITAPR